MTFNQRMVSMVGEWVRYTNKQGFHSTGKLMSVTVSEGIVSATVSPNPLYSGLEDFVVWPDKPIELRDSQEGRKT